MGARRRAPRRGGCVFPGVRGAGGLWSGVMTPLFRISVLALLQGLAALAAILVVLWATTGAARAHGAGGHVGALAAQGAAQGSAEGAVHSSVHSDAHSAAHADGHFDGHSGAEADPSCCHAQAGAHCSALGPPPGIFRLDRMAGRGPRAETRSASRPLAAPAPGVPPPIRSAE